MSAKKTEPQKTPTGALTLSRILRVTKPLMKGEDVKAVQKALIERKLGCGIDGANGVYNANTALAVRYFQSYNGLL
jgi:peptidoglycan hydrolase-like protein with peptidoglycan-binding domain